MKYVIGILVGIALSLLMVSMHILMMLILPVHEHDICFHLCVSSLITFSVLCIFLSTGLSPPWLGLFLDTLFFLLL